MAHVYKKPGTYKVALCRTGFCYDTSFQTITINPKPVANFTTTPVCLGYKFTDKSTIASPGVINSYLWLFGDGDSSRLQSPTHVYKSAGKYNVSLIVTSQSGCKDSITKTEQVYAGPIASLGFNGVSCLNTPVSFTNNTTGAGTISYVWNFGDGDSTTITNPTHTYTNLGTYTVTLRAKSSYGCQSVNNRTNISLCPG
jgi:PKD repeat protein